MQHILVSAGVILNDAGKVLICRRSGALSGLWEFPGGKLESGETPGECLKRELMEELDLETEPEEELLRITKEDGNREIELIFLKAKCISGTSVTLHVHEAAVWEDPIQLCNYTFCPADAQFVHRYFGAEIKL